MVLLVLPVPCENVRVSNPFTGREFSQTTYVLVFSVR